MNPAHGDFMAADRERRTVLAANLVRFEADYAEGTITGLPSQKATARVEARLSEIEEPAGTRRSVGSPITLAAAPGQEFMDAPIDVQRAMLSSVLRVEGLSRLRAWASHGRRSDCTWRP